MLQSLCLPGFLHPQHWRFHISHLRFLWSNVCFDWLQLLPAPTSLASGWFSVGVTSSRLQLPSSGPHLAWETWMDPLLPSPKPSKHWPFSGKLLLHPTPAFRVLDENTSLQISGNIGCGVLKGPHQSPHQPFHFVLNKRSGWVHMLSTPFAENCPSDSSLGSSLQVSP